MPEIETVPEITTVNEPSFRRPAWSSAESARERGATDAGIARGLELFVSGCCNRRTVEPCVCGGCARYVVLDCAVMRRNVWFMWCFWWRSIRGGIISTAVTVPISLASSSSSSEDGGDDVNPIRLTLAFLAIDVFFLAIRSIILCLISAGYCFCLPCIIAFMYYIGKQDPASVADISRLPKYIFEVDNVNGDVEQPDVRACRMIPMRRNGSDFSTERVLLTKDANKQRRRGLNPKSIHNPSHNVDLFKYNHILKVTE
ncbi:hypothetical protein L1987_39022 [Smallanthus sonchifolius]|uniref:Uncharacterized protein n=1 Tax=Smallanthus sonchifolius TaxID=185202 RepID=A0ACB9HL55_9ASTR|nr:hypothetical protein L1987_39022 [Smallanthus sonchifolius]